MLVGLKQQLYILLEPASFLIQPDASEHKRGSAFFHQFCTLNDTKDFHTNRYLVYSFRHISVSNCLFIDNNMSYKKICVKAMHDSYQINILAHDKKVSKIEMLSDV